MKIKSKLFVVFLMYFMSMTLLLAYSIYTIQKLNGSVNEIVNQHYKKVEYTSTIRNEVNTLAKGLRDYLLSESNLSPISDEIAQKHFDTVTRAQENGTKALLDLEKMEKDEQHVLLINRLKAAGAEYLAFQQDVIKKIQNGNISDAAMLLAADGQKYQQNMFNIIEELVTINKLSMQQAVDASSSLYHQSLLYLSILALLVFIVATVFRYRVTRGIMLGLDKISKVMEGFSKGSMGLDTRLDVSSKDEIGIVAASFNQMADSLQSQATREKQWTLEMEGSSWLHGNLTKLFTSIQEIDDTKMALEGTLHHVMPQIGALFGVIYITVENAEDHSVHLEKMASYAGTGLAFTNEKKRVELGEGLIGECGIEKKSIEITDPPPDYFNIQSGLGSAVPRHILIIPLLLGRKLKGVMEIAGLHKFTEIQMEFINEMSTLLAIHINKIKNKNQIENLLEETQLVSRDLQAQSDELQLQQEELERMNAELEEQTASLEESEHQLQIQQAELENINVELMGKTQKLEESNRLFQEQNRSLEKTTRDLTEAISYKSMFLANMSHELRTPLNSLLILAKHLADNKDANLTAKQVEFALTIHSSGRDLLLLINEILELAKIESKKVEFTRERIQFQDVLGFVQRSFDPVAQQKALQFHIQIDPGLPQSFYSDQQRLLQILQNLLSNAFKFTEHGSVTFSIRGNLPSSKQPLKPNEQMIEFSVADTGIGIEKDKQGIVFDAFVQADGTTSRKYGGTGLGLSISKEIANLLGGEIRLESTYGEGSLFTLALPVEMLPVDPPPSPEINGVNEQNEIALSAPTPKKLDNRTVLLVDDDIRNVFALSNVLESYGLTMLYAGNGHEALDVLEKNAGINAILMDIMMPVMDGYEAMKRIRSIPEYRDLPIIAVTAKAMKDDRGKCIEAGASDYITKPVDVDQLISLLKVWLYTKDGGR